MKKVLSIIVPILLVIALCYYFFGSGQEYDFLANLKTISNYEWSNPIDTLTSIFKQFQALTSMDWSGDFFGSLSSLPSLIVNLFMAPINMIVSVFKDIVNILKALLLMVGFNVNF